MNEPDGATLSQGMYTHQIMTTSAVNTLQFVTYTSVKLTQLQKKLKV